jgi:hypothetical protein
VPGGYVEQPISPWSLHGAEWRGGLREAISRYQATLLDLWNRRNSPSAARPDSQPISVTQQGGNVLAKIRSLDLRLCSTVDNSRPLGYKAPRPRCPRAPA